MGLKKFFAKLLGFGESELEIPAEPSPKEQRDLEGTLDSVAEMDRLEREITKKGEQAKAKEELHGAKKEEIASDVDEAFEDLEQKTQEDKDIAA